MTTPNNTVAGLPVPALVFYTHNHFCDFADGVEILSTSTNFYSEEQMQAALASPAPSATVGELEVTAYEILDNLKSGAALQHPAAPSVERPSPQWYRHRIMDGDGTDPIAGPLPPDLARYECSNPAQRHSYDCDPRGPCPKCVKGGYGNWSCFRIAAPSMPPSVAGDAGELPELPTSKGYLYLHNTGGVSQVHGYTADQVRAYGEQCRRLATAEQPIQWDGAIRTMQEHLYVMTGERDRYRMLAEQQAEKVARLEQRIAEQPDTEGVPFCPRCGAHPDEQPGSAVQGGCVTCKGRGTLMGGRVICGCTCGWCGQPSNSAPNGCGGNHSQYATPAPAAEQGDDSFVRIENVVRTLPPGYAFADAVEHAAPETITQPEARGAEGMVLVPSGVMKRIERDYEEWGKTAFAAYVRDLLAAEQTESRWNFAGIDLAPDLLRLVGIKNAIGANPDGQACFDSAASELARKMLNEFQKQWTDCAPLNTPNNREK